MHVRIQYTVMIQYRRIHIDNHTLYGTIYDNDTKITKAENYKIILYESEKKCSSINYPKKLVSLPEM